MRLFTRLQKLPDIGEWRLLSVESSYVRDRLVTAFPCCGDASSPLVLTDEVKAYPKCYRNLAFVMLQRGLKPRTDLPNEDDQESISRIQDRNRAFLNGTEAGFI